MGEKRIDEDGQQPTEKRTRREGHLSALRASAGDTPGTSPLHPATTSSTLAASLDAADATIVASPHNPVTSISAGIGTLGDFTSIADDEIAAAAVAAATAAAASVSADTTVILNPSTAAPLQTSNLPSTVVPDGPLASGTEPSQGVGQSGNISSNLTGDNSVRVPPAAVSTLPVGPIAFQGTEQVPQPSLSQSGEPGAAAAQGGPSAPIIGQSSLDPAKSASALAGNIFPSSVADTYSPNNVAQAASVPGKTASPVAVTTPDPRARPHICKACGRGFLRTGDMNRHYATVHEKIRRAKCPICGGKV